MRLAKYLAAAGVASRRKAEQIIREGRVTVNGERALLPQTGVSAGDEILVDGIPVRSPEHYYYLLLDKPIGFVSTVSDPHGRPTVLDLVKDIPARIYPVGRLDADTSGVLLLTNDGGLAYRLTHPRFHVEKEYRAWVKGFPSAETLQQLSRGVEVEGRKTAPAQVRAVRKGNGCTLLDNVLTEGRKRQVKQMCAAVGHPVLKLRRIRFAFLTARGLRAGAYRHLSRSEVKKLYHLVKMGSNSSV
ncbi:MAG TPA: pseudouridine synthase [Bacillota bacterium]|nr:pseudouridine synthase [Bacillota bacterium]